MTPFAEIFTSILSVLTLAGLITVLLLLILRFTPIAGNDNKNLLTHFLGEHSLLLTFIVTITGIAGSLFYSNTIGFTPCSLCWWARIFLYPQAVILLIALIKKDTHAHIYCIALSIIGAIITLYHSWIQLTGNSLFPCATDPSGAGGCDVRYFIDYGFVTLPFMGFTAFILIISILLFRSKQTKMPS